MEKKLSTPKLRKMWREYFDQCDQIMADYAGACIQWSESIDQMISSGSTHPIPDCPKHPKTLPFPEELIGLMCCAKTRAGTPCKRTDLYRSARCKLHGGLSTGPRTEVGKARSSLNGIKTKRTS